MKANPDIRLIRYLSSLSPYVGFDCASINEIKLILSLGIPGSRIIFAAPIKNRSALAFAAKHDVKPDIEVVPIDYVNKAMERLVKADVRYRFVIDIGNTLKPSS